MVPLAWNKVKFETIKNYFIKRHLVLKRMKLISHIKNDVEERDEAGSGEKAGVS